MAADLEALRSRVAAVARRRDRVNQDVARAEAASGQAKSVLKKHGAATVKEARAKQRELEKEIEQLQRGVERGVSEIERALAEAVQT